MSGLGSIDRLNVTQKTELERLRQAEQQARGTEVRETSSAKPPQDINDISPDWNQMVKDLMDAYRTFYRGVDITTKTVHGTEQLKQYAVALGWGNHLVVSEEFLSKMASGAEAFYKGKELLDGLLQQLSVQQNQGGFGVYVGGDSLQYWSAEPKQAARPNTVEKPQKSLAEMMEEARQKAEELRKKFQITVDKSAYNAPSETYTKLAKARTVVNVKGVIADAERRIYNLKLALSLGPEEDRSKVRAALAQMERAVGRAQGKIKDLEGEEDLRLQQKKAEKQQQERHAEQLKMERERRQKLRHVREYGQIVEGKQWYYDPFEYLRMKQAYKPDEPVPAEGAAGFAAAPVGSPDMGIGVGAPVISAADVVVSAPVELLL